MARHTSLIALTLAAFAFAFGANAASTFTPAEPALNMRVEPREGADARLVLEGRAVFAGRKVSGTELSEGTGDRMAAAHNRSQIVLEGPITADSSELAKLATGSVPKEFRLEFTDRNGNVTAVYVLHNCLVSGYRMLRGSGSQDVAMEQLTLTPESIEVVK